SAVASVTAVGSPGAVSRAPAYQSANNASGSSGMPASSSTLVMRHRLLAEAERHGIVAGGQGGEVAAPVALPRPSTPGQSPGAGGRAAHVAKQRGEGAPCKRKRPGDPGLRKILVGVRGFEPPAPTSRT